MKEDGLHESRIARIVVVVAYLAIDGAEAQQFINHRPPDPDDEEKRGDE